MSAKAVSRWITRMLGWWPKAKPERRRRARAACPACGKLLAIAPGGQLWRHRCVPPSGTEGV